MSCAANEAPLSPPPAAQERGDLPPPGGGEARRGEINPTKRTERMTDIALKAPTAANAQPSAWAALAANRNWLGLWFMLPAAAFLILFLAYPLALGVWISFTDARIGQS